MPDCQANKQMLVLPEGDVSQMSPTQHAWGEKTFIYVSETFTGEFWTGLSCKPLSLSVLEVTNFVPLVSQNLEQ